MLRGRTLTLALVLLPLVATGCGNDARPAATESPAKVATAPAAVIERTIHIDNFTYDPEELTVKAGTRVKWINRDDVPHTATSTAKPRAFDSKTLDTDQQFSIVFDKPGTYEYFCAVHPKMTGRVIVK
jgi:plastocyanin